MRTSIYAIFIGLLFSGSCYAQATAEERIRAQVREAVVNTSKLYGSQTTITLSEPIRSYVDLGAIIRPDGKVILVRHDSIAADMALRKDDIVLRVDDIEVTPATFTEVIGYLESLDHAQAFQLTISRDEQTLELEGVAKATVVPGWQLVVDNAFNELDLTTSARKACGRVSVFQQPPTLHDLYPAVISSIDGKPVHDSSAIIKLTAGDYTLGVSELISANDYQRPRQASREKLIEITLPENMTLQLAAYYSSSSSAASEWRPKVWKRRSQPCQGH